MYKHLTQEIKKVHREHVSKKKKEQRRIEVIKGRLSKEKTMTSRIRNQLNSEIRKIRRDEEVYKKQLMKKLDKEKQEAIKSTLERQASFIKRKLIEKKARELFR